jgi:hypothetical protein
MIKYKLIVLTLCSLITFTSYSQYGWRDSNRIGLLVGPNFTNVMTNNVETISKMGWTAGAQVRGNFHNYWSGVYGIRFVESNFAVNTRTPGGRPQEVNYKTRAVQINFLFSYNLIEDVMSLDIGPVLQINSDLKFKKGLQRNTIDGTDLLVKEFTKINPFNGLLYLGTTIGNNKVRANFNYTIGINNTFNRLNKQEGLINKNNFDKFNGRMGIFSAMLQVNL